MANRTLAEIIEECRYLVSEPTPAFFTDKEIMLFYNAVQMEFVKWTKILKEETDLAISAVDNVSVTLPADFLATKFVHLKSSDGSLQFLHPYGGRARGVRSPMSEDLGYYLINNTTLKLTQEQDPNSDEVRLAYYQTPTPFADEVADLAVSCDIEDAYIDGVLAGTVSRLFKKRRELQESNIYFAEFQKKMAEARRFENKREGVRQMNIIY